MPSLRISKEFPNDTYFITPTVIEWIDIFTKPEYFQILSDSLIYCQEKRGLIIYAYVFMTNHIHLIVQSENEPLEDTIRDFKRHTTKEIKKELEKDNRKYIKTLLANSYGRKKGNEFQVWQRENYPKIMDGDLIGQKIDYIHYNPVRKGYVDRSEDWFYSSAAFYNIENSEKVGHRPIPCIEF